jgi:GTP-binding protein HflX
VIMLRTKIHDHVEWPVELAEFRQLVEAAGFEVVDNITQTRIHRHSAYLLGKGRVEELAQRVAGEEIEVVAVYNVLTSMQKYKLQKLLGCEVLDRYEVVLRVFEREARDRVSQLQLELARLQKSYPFIKVAVGERLKRERPSRGEASRGGGEYAYHSKLQLVRKRIAKVKRELSKLRRENMSRLRARQKLGVPMVCLVGCYNAGKTSLFNALTGAEKEVSERPFTTLASKVSRASNPGVFFVDTIGFALDLDPSLISAFQLNLDDMRASDVIVLVVDAADDLILLRMKIHSVLNILDATGIERRRIIIALNKADLAGARLAEQVIPFIEEHFDLEWVAVSASTGYNLTELELLIRKRYAALA